MTDKTETYARAAAFAARALDRRAQSVRDPAVKRAMLELAETVRVRPVYHLVSLRVAAVESATWTIMHPLWGCSRDLIACETAWEVHRQMPRLTAEAARHMTDLTGLHRADLVDGVAYLTRVCRCRPDQACAHILKPVAFKDPR